MQAVRRWKHPIAAPIVLLLAATFVAAATGSVAEGQEAGDGDGSVRVTKQVDGNPQDGPFGFTIDCDDGFADTFDLRDGESITFTRPSEPYNECTITETDRQGADLSFWTLVLPDGSTVQDDADNPPPVTIVADLTRELTYVNVFASDGEGSVRVTKQVDGNPPGGPFGFTIDCDDGFADTFDLRDGESVTFTRPSEPYNECTITETDRQGADLSFWTLVLTDGSTVQDDADNPPPVTIVADLTRELTYVNVFGGNGDPKPGESGDESTEAPKEPEPTEDPAEEPTEEPVEEPTEEPVEAERPTRVEAGSGGQLPTTGLPAVVLVFMALGLLLIGIGSLAHSRR